MEKLNLLVLNRYVFIADFLKRVAYQGNKIEQMKAFPLRDENQSIWEPSQLI